MFTCLRLFDIIKVVVVVVFPVRKVTVNTMLD